MNNLITPLKFLTILLFNVSNLSAQLHEFEETLEPMFSKPDDNGWMYFSTPNNYPPGACFDLYKNVKSDSDNDMVLLESHIDSLIGFTHYKFQQHFKGVPVEGAGCIEHFDPQGNLVFTNAKHAIGITKDPTPSISESSSVRSLINSFPDSTVFAWDNEDWEQQLKTDKNDTSATWYPTGELMFAIDSMYNVGGDIFGSRYTLAYKIPITTLSPKLETKIYYLDANSGDILKIRSTEMENVTAGVYGYGNQLIDAEWVGGFVQKFQLEATDGNHNIHTKKYQPFEGPWTDWDETRLGSDNWGNTYLTETSAHFHVTKTWDFFSSYFGRVGIDGTGDNLRVTTQFAKTAFIPSSTPSPLVFGYNSGLYSYGNEPSVVAHEFTHGVTYFTSGLTYSFQSGALNESFSDIFGIVYQAQMLDGGNTYWIIGNFVPNTLQETRSFIAPSTRGDHWEGEYQVDGNGAFVLDQNGNKIPIYELGQPNSYLDNRWCSDCPYGVDNGGVHINSGVQNRWFYLLANGDQTITGVGITNASKIAYLALTSLLQNSSQYYDSKNATIQAAINLFGECSQEHRSTVDAWDEVGISANYSCPGLSLAEILNNSFVKIFPNPSNGIVKVITGYEIDEPIEIMDLNGKIIKTVKLNHNHPDVDLSDFRNGVYFIKININEQTIIKKIVKQ